VSNFNKDFIDADQVKLIKKYKGYKLV